MHSYRYRTKTLLGPWRSNADDAVKDAVRSKQARRDDEGDGWHWVVAGTIEERKDGAQAYSRNDNFDLTATQRRRA